MVSRIHRLWPHLWKTANSLENLKGADCRGSIYSLFIACAPNVWAGYYCRTYRVMSRCPRNDHQCYLGHGKIVSWRRISYGPTFAGLGRNESLPFALFLLLHLSWRVFFLVFSEILVWLVGFQFNGHVVVRLNADSAWKAS